MARPALSSSSQTRLEGEEPQVRAVQQPLVGVVPAALQQRQAHGGVRDVGDRHQDPALGPEQDSRVAERRPGVDEVLEHVAEDDRVERLGLEVLRERAACRCPRSPARRGSRGPARRPRRRCRRRSPVQPRSDQGLGGVTGGAPDVQDDLVAPDERDQLGLAVVRVVEIDRGLVAGHMLSVVLVRPKRAGLKAPSWARELALNSTSGRVGNRPWRDVADGPGPGGPDQDSAATGGPWCETPSRGCPGPTASDSAAARGVMRSGQAAGIVATVSSHRLPPRRAPVPTSRPRPRGFRASRCLLPVLRPAGSGGRLRAAHPRAPPTARRPGLRRLQLPLDDDNTRPPRVRRPTRSGSARTSGSTSGPTRSRWSRSAPRSSPSTTRCCCSTAPVFGPVGSFDAVFAEMDARDDIDFWGITEHGPTRKHPVQQDRPLAAHIQTHWLACRRSPGDLTGLGRVLGRDADDRDLPRLDRSTTRRGSRRGSWSAATPVPRRSRPTNYGSQHPIMDNPVAMVRDGCPLVKRRSFFYDPLYNEWKANDGRQLAPPHGRARLPDGPRLPQPGAHLQAALAGHQHGLDRRAARGRPGLRPRAPAAGGRASRTSSTRR